MSFEPGQVPSGFVSITPSDTTVLGLVGIYVGTTGDVTVSDLLGNTTTWVAVPAGFRINGLITKVKATGTTASNIVGLLP